MNKIQCFLSEEKIKQIDLICKQEKFTRAELNRRAIDGFLNRQDVFSINAKQLTDSIERVGNPSKILDPLLEIMAGTPDYQEYSCELWLKGLSDNPKLEFAGTKTTAASSARNAILYFEELAKTHSKFEIRNFRKV